MGDEAQFPFNIPLGDLYLVRTPAVATPQTTETLVEKLHREHRGLEAQLRATISELKRELERTKSRINMVAASTEEPLSFVSVPEKILAPDGSSQQDYRP